MYKKSERYRYLSFFINKDKKKSYEKNIKDSRKLYIDIGKDPYI